jgi:dTDP-4-dehydrorhamnose 3,5-epimerase
MLVEETSLEGLLLITPKVFKDNRGFFLETYNSKRYEDALGTKLEFVQDNHSRSSRNVLRGLHYQKNSPQGKLVRVVSGSIFDVAVDIRTDSVTYGKWHGEELSQDNKKQLWIPPGFAHGFLTLSDSADLEYKCTDYYDPLDEGCILWNDPSVAIDWKTGEPSISEKDSLGLLLKEI